MTLRLGRGEFTDSDLLVMAIVNRTPDSFFDRGATWEDKAAMERVHQVVAVIPAQIGAIIGAKVVATWAIRRWGGTRASRALLFIIAIAMLPLLGVQADTPAWYLVGIAAIFSCAGMGALTVLNAEVMRRAPAASTGSVSSFRTAASSIGATFGVAVFGTLIISAVQVDAGITAVSLAQLEELAERLRIVGAISSTAALLGGLALLRVLRRQTA